MNIGSSLRYKIYNCPNVTSSGYLWEPYKSVIDVWNKVGIVVADFSHRETVGLEFNEPDDE